MYCVALTDYDQHLPEDPKTNGMHESIEISSHTILTTTMLISRARLTTLNYNIELHFDF